MKACSVPGCNNVEGNGVSIFKFIKRKRGAKRFETWMEKLNVSEPVPEDTFVCSAHFAIDSFTATSLEKRRCFGNKFPLSLTSGAVPLKFTPLKKKNPKIVKQPPKLIPTSHIQGTNKVKFSDLESKLKTKEQATPNEISNNLVCLSWNKHNINLKNLFPMLLQKEQYVDVSLCCDGQVIKCHKVVLSFCSSYFDKMFKDISPIQHPIIVLKDVSFEVLTALVEFMYVGEVKCRESLLPDMFEAAKALQITSLLPDSENATVMNSAQEPREELDDSGPPILDLEEYPDYDKTGGSNSKYYKDSLKQSKARIPDKNKSPVKTSTSSNDNAQPSSSKYIDFAKTIAPKTYSRSNVDKNKESSVSKKRKLGNDYGDNPDLMQQFSDVLKKGTKTRPTIRKPSQYSDLTWASDAPTKSTKSTVNETNDTPPVIDLEDPVYEQFMKTSQMFNKNQNKQLNLQKNLTLQKALSAIEERIANINSVNLIDEDD